MEDDIKILWDWHEFNLYSSINTSGIFRIQDIEGHYGGSFSYSPDKGVTAKIISFENQQLNYIKENHRHIKYIHVIIDGPLPITIFKTYIDTNTYNKYGTCFNMLANTCFLGIHLDEGTQVSGACIVYNILDDFMKPRPCDEEHTPDDSGEIIIDEKISIRFFRLRTYSNKNICYSFDDRKDKAIKECIKEKLDAAGYQYHPSSEIKSKFSIHLNMECSIDNIGLLYNTIYKIGQFLFILTASPIAPIHSSLCCKQKIGEEIIEQSYTWLRTPGVSEKIRDDFLYNGFCSVQKNPIYYNDIKYFLQSMISTFFNDYDKNKYILGKLYTVYHSSNDYEMDLSALIDAFSAIAQSENISSRSKYQDIIKKYSTKKFNNYILKLFDVNSFEELGKSISDVRSEIVHGQLNPKSILYKIKEKTPMTLNIMSLVLLYYLQKNIGLPEYICQKFQDNWLEIYLDAERITL